MEVTPIQKNRFITPKNTGYAAAIGLGLSVWSAKSKNKTFRSTHKSLAAATVIMTLLHIGLIEYLHNSWQKQLKKQH